MFYSTFGTGSFPVFSILGLFGLVLTESLPIFLTWTLTMAYNSASYTYLQLITVVSLGGAEHGQK
jgi:hypothetical protein